MNVWQYSRWVYLIGRSIKNKSLIESERQAFITFIEKILVLRPFLSQRINIKKGYNANSWKDQNDYSLGKMLQVIGRNLKIVVLTQEEKELCDKLFISTDKRRFMTYNDYQPSGTKDIFVSPNDDLQYIVENCQPYSNIILTGGDYDVDLHINVDHTKIIASEKSVVRNIKVSASDVTLEGITVKATKPIEIHSDKKLISLFFDKLDVNTSIEYNVDVENVSVTNCFVDGEIEFNKKTTGIIIAGNNFTSENGIVLNGEVGGVVIIENNKLNTGE